MGANIADWVGRGDPAQYTDYPTRSSEKDEIFVRVHCLSILPVDRLAAKFANAMAPRLTVLFLKQGDINFSTWTLNLQVPLLKPTDRPNVSLIFIRDFDKLINTVNGGSRISKMGTPAPEFGTKTYYLTGFSQKNCMKMKEIGP